MLSSPPITLAVCTNFFPEAEALIGRGELQNITLVSWDATCQCPVKTWEEIALLFDQKDKSTKPLVILGSCFSRSLPSRPEFMKHIYFEPLEQCFELICDKEIVASLIKEKSYLTSSGWLKSWRKTLADWGFDQPLARQFFQDTTTKTVLLDTGIYPDAVSELESFAAYVDLPAQHIRIGLDHFFQRVSAILSTIRGEFLQQRLLLNEEKLAQYELSLSLLDRLTDSQTEQDAVSGLVEIFHTLFAPHNVHFHRHRQTASGSDVGTNVSCNDDTDVSIDDFTGANTNGSAIDREFLPAEKHQLLERNKFLLHESLDGFWLVLKSGSFIAGYLNVTRVMVPEYLNRYLNLALAIAPLCALAVSRGRFAEQRQKDMKVLQQKNEEIEQFVYSASHDLRSPVVTISTFLGVLERDMANHKPERIQKDIAYIRGATEKMDQLLTGLLYISHASRLVRTPQSIDFKVLVNSSLAALAGDIHDQHIDVVIEPDTLLLRGDPVQFGQIWQNLIENAIKYRGDQPAPQIVIGVDNTKEHPEFYVCDNGMGIEPKHANRIFGLFAQLNPDNAGHGLGLTLVKRLVELYQGSIRVESEGKGKGSCFKFTLPSAVKIPIQEPKR